MGRLIDADKLKAELETHKVLKRTALTKYECGYNRGLTMAAYCLANTDTIDAIPVDWLENYLKKEANKGLESDALLVAYGMVILCKWKEEQEGK